VSPPVQAARIYTHHRHLLLLSPKADTHFTVSQSLKVEGLVDVAEVRTAEFIVQAVYFGAQ